jgi:hypothetical protein
MYSRLYNNGQIRLSFPLQVLASETLVLLLSWIILKKFMLILDVQSKNLL